MTSFDERLEKAIGRGQRTGRAREQEEAEKALSEQELRRLHTQYRLQLSEHIESCLRKLADHFPGFRFETVVSDRGWGAAIQRDDVGTKPSRQRASFFSRLEMTIRPLSKYYVLDLAAKATIRNREYFARSHFQRLAEVDLQSFTELIDLWCLEYAELYAAKS
jgi:hypothetical protein